MMKTIFALSLFVFTIFTGTAFGFENCRLMVLSTGAPNGGLTWTNLRYERFSLEQCDQLCKDDEALKREINPYIFVMNCKMKFIHEDGTITKAKYNFVHWPLKK